MNPNQPRHRARPRNAQPFRDHYTGDPEVDGGQVAKEGHTGGREQTGEHGREVGHERREEHERARRGAGGNGGRDGDRDRDRGSASLLVVALGAAVIALALGIAAASQVVIARHRARNSADAGALAGAQMLADGAETACAAADRLVRENRGRMTACVVRGDTVTVTAEVRTRAGAVTQRARAGPVDATG